MCNFALCSTLVTHSSSRECVICERVYCDKHCRRRLFFEDDRPEYVCQFCFPYVFKPFKSKLSSRGLEGVSSVVQWIPDLLVNECTEPDCSVMFTAFQLSLKKRRHHCRLCGNVFCDKHCSKRIVLSELNISDAVRVCNYCYMLYVDY